MKSVFERCQLHHFSICHELHAAAVLSGSSLIASYFLVLLRWVSPIICCYAHTQRQRGLQVTGRRVSELWDVHENPSQQRQVARLGYFYAKLCKLHQAKLYKFVQEQKPQQEGVIESPPPGRLVRLQYFTDFAAFLDEGGMKTIEEGSGRSRRVRGVPIFAPTRCLFQLISRPTHLDSRVVRDGTKLQIHVGLLCELVPHTQDKWIPQNSLKTLSDQSSMGGIHHYLRNNTILTRSEDCCMATASSNLQILLLKLWRCEI